MECAIKIQSDLLRDPKIPLRIGIHSGDIVYDDEGVYGDAVNVASRIECAQALIQGTEAHCAV